MKENLTEGKLPTADLFNLHKFVVLLRKLMKSYMQDLLTESSSTHVPQQARRRCSSFSAGKNAQISICNLCLEDADNYTLQRTIDVDILTHP